MYSLFTNCKKLSCIVLMGLTLSAYSQSMPFFKYGVKNGLPASAVYECIQDKSGFLWLATEFGLCRLDGSRFTTYSIKDGLKVNDVWGLFEDSRGRIWIRSFSSYLSYWEKGEFHHIKLPESLDIPWILNVAETKDGTLWFGTSLGIISLTKNNSLTYHGPQNSPFKSKALLLYENERGKWFLSGLSIIQLSETDTTFWNLPNRFIECVEIFAPYENDHWTIITAKEIVFWNIEKGTLKVKPITDIAGLPSDIVIKSTLNNYENLKSFWLQTNHGLFVISEDFKLDSSFRFINHKRFEHVYSDRESNLWMMGRSDGLHYFPAKALEMNMLNFGSDTQQKNLKVMAFAKDNESNILLGTDRGVQVFTNEGELKEPAPEWDRFVREMYYYPQKDLMIIGSEFSVMYLPADELHNIHYLENSSKLVVVDDYNVGNEWELAAEIGSVGTFAKNGQFNPNTGKLLVSSGNGLFEIDFSCDKPRLKKLLADRTYAVSKDDSNNIWFGRTNGIGLINGAGELQFPFKEDSMYNVSVLDLKIDRQNIIWVATDGHGVFGFEPKGEKVYKIEELKWDIVKRISLDDKNRIWLATNKGVKVISIISLQPFKYEVQSIFSQDGLISDEVNNIVFKDDKVLAATNQGFSIFNSNIPSNDELNVKMAITGVLVDARNINVFKKGILKYSENDLEIGFSGLVFQQHKSLTYKYRLQGLSDNWNTTTNNYVSFHNLKPGEYRFEVEIAGPKEFKGENRAYWEFTIIPHWTQMIWVKAGVFGLLLSGLLFVLFWWVNSNRLKSKLQEEISALQSKALQAQMNPHFIFNALNSIQYFISSKNTDAANESLALFGRLIRLNLEISSSKMVSIQKELSCLEFYLELEKMRFGKQLVVNIDVDNNLMEKNILIPGLILQPFVEIILSNGARNAQNEPVNIEINISRDTDTITIHMSSSGFDDEAKIKSSKRIIAVEKRLKLMYKNYKGLSFIDVAKNQGQACCLEIDVRIPYRHKSE